MNEILKLSDNGKTVVDIIEKSVETLTIPEGVCNIASGVLTECDHLKVINLPSSFNQKRSSWNCKTLQYLNISSDNPNYSSVDGILYNKEKTEILVVPKNYNQSCLTIPESVRVIKSCAFYNCNSLKEIKIQDGTVYIEWSAFWNCKSLISIYIPDSVESIGENAFSHCESLISVRLSSKIKKIEKDTFFGCVSLDKLVIPESVEALGENAFLETSLRELIIPKNVVSIDPSNFQTIHTLKNLRNIDVDKDNQYYSSVDGILMDKNHQHILAIPVKKDISTFIIPEGVEEIDNDFFVAGSLLSYKMRTIKHLSIPDSVTVIPEGKFKDCENLRTINLAIGIKDIGPSAFQNCSSLQRVQIPGSVEKIGTGAFSGCESLQEVIVENGVSIIDNEAFQECHSLQKLVVADSVSVIGESTFMNNSSIKEIILPNNLKSIGESAFAGCVSIESIEIPNGVEYIGKEAFDGCSALREVILPQQIKVIKESTFSNCSSLQFCCIPNGVKEIERWAFGECTSLKDVSLPETLETISGGFNNCIALKTVFIPRNVAEIKVGSFKGCVSLNSFIVDKDNSTYSSHQGAIYSKDKTKLFYVPEGIVSNNYIIPKGVKDICQRAFLSCKGIADISLPEGLISIGLNSFLDCRSIVKISIPSSVIEIGRGAFSGCNGLKDIYVDNGNIHYSTIDGVLFDASVTTLIKYPPQKIAKQYVVPKSVTTICRSAFGSCDYIECIEIPYGVKIIEDFVFARCKSLLKVDIPESIVKIGSCAFEGCISLREIELPNCIANIDNWAFRYCSSLLSIDIPNSLYEINSSVFEGCISLKELDIPNSIRKIGAFAFKDCKSLSCIILPDSITDINWGAFQGCTSLEKIVLPPNLSVISRYLFMDCTSLSEVVFPTKVSEIEAFAFHHTGIKNIVLPNSINSIGEHAFCKSPIEYYYVDNKGKALSQDINTFFSRDDVLYRIIGVRWSSKDEHMESYALVKYPQAKKDKSYKVDENTIWIGECAFKLANNLEAIELHDEINSIARQAFAYCESLKTMKMPKGLKYVPYRSFIGCKSLVEVFLTSVEKIYSEAFSECSNLRDIHLYCDDANKMTIEEKVFDGVDFETCNLHVPSGSRWSYRHHPVFGKFKNIIIEK